MKSFLQYDECEQAKHIAYTKFIIVKHDVTTSHAELSHAIEYCVIVY